MELFFLILPQLLLQNDSSSLIEQLLPHLKTKTHQDENYTESSKEK